jgi:hypothetical protein
MTIEEIKQFYREIGDVCIKYNISGITGVWFSGEGNDEFGGLQYHDVNDSRMGLIIQAISGMYAEWARVALNHVPKPIGSIHEIRRPDNDTADN